MAQCVTQIANLSASNKLMSDQAINCPTCGATNSINDRFCGECGSPLDGENEATIISQRPIVDDDDDNDNRTMMSMPASIPDDEAQTLAVSQAELQAALGSEGGNFDPPPPPPSGDDGSSQESGNNLFSQRNIIIAVVVLLLICCCCALLGGVLSILANEGLMEEIQRELGLLTLYLV